MVEFLFCLTVSKLLAISKDFAVVQLADCIKNLHFIETPGGVSTILIGLFAPWDFLMRRVHRPVSTSY